MITRQCLCRYSWHLCLRQFCGIDAFCKQGEELLEVYSGEGLCIFDLLLLSGTEIFEHVGITYHHLIGLHINAAFRGDLESESTGVCIGWQDA